MCVYTKWGMTSRAGCVRHDRAADLRGRRDGRRLADAAVPQGRRVVGQEHYPDARVCRNLYDQVTKRREPGEKAGAVRESGTCTRVARSHHADRTPRTRTTPRNSTSSTARVVYVLMRWPSMVCACVVRHDVPHQILPRHPSHPLSSPPTQSWDIPGGRRHAVQQHRAQVRAFGPGRQAAVHRARDQGRHPEHRVRRDCAGEGHAIFAGRQLGFGVYCIFMLQYTYTNSICPASFTFPLTDERDTVTNNCH